MAAPRKATPSKAATANPRLAAMQAYCKAKAAGQSNAAALAKAKAVAPVGHAICDLAWYAHASNPAQVVALPHAAMPAGPVAQGNCAVALRGGAGWQGHYVGKALSWGAITIALGMYTPGDAKSPEGQVRTLAAKASGLASEGQRIGRGGRWLSNDAALYPGNHKAIGVEAAKPRQADRAALAAGADQYTSKVQAMAKAKAKAAGKVRKPRAPKAPKA